MNPATFAIVNSVVYLALFVPPLLLLLSTRLAFLELPNLR